jgi:DNA-binding CsgD family transcriptional regulator
MVMAKQSRQHRSAQLLRLIGQVYDAALDEQLWSGVAPLIASAFDSTSTAVITQNVKKGAVQGLSVTANLEPSVWESYRAHYYKHDIWAQRGAAMGMSRIYTGNDLVTDAYLQRTEFYDFLRQSNTFHLVGSVFQIAENEIGILGIHRPHDARTFGDEDKNRATIFLPHLSRALQIRSRLMEAELRHQTAIDVLERMGVAVLVVALKGEIVYANSQAELLLRDADGIRSDSGRITTTSGSATERLSSLIHTSIETAAGREGSAGGAVTVPRLRRMPLSLLIAPFRPAQNSFGPWLPSALLFVRDPECATPATSALQNLFGLTAAEASIAAALARGQSLEEIAASHGIRIGTARTHLKSILGKTGTNRQAQLVTLLLRSVAAF